MSLQGIITSNIAIGGSNFSSSTTITDSGQIAADVTLTAGQAGTLSTYTSTTEGTATLSTGHGITTGVKVNIYWTGGCRYGVTVGTVNVNSVPFSLGEGADLPIQGTVIVVALCTTINVDVTGNDVSIIAAQGSQAGNVTFYASNDSVISNVELLGTFASWIIPILSIIPLEIPRLALEEPVLKEPTCPVPSLSNQPVAWMFDTPTPVPTNTFFTIS